MSCARLSGRQLSLLSLRFSFCRQVSWPRLEGRSFSWLLDTSFNNSDQAGNCHPLTQHSAQHVVRESELSYQLSQALQLTQLLWQALQLVLLDCEDAEVRQTAELHWQGCQLVVTGHMRKQTQVRFLFYS